MKSLLGDTKVTSFVPVQLPDEERLVPGGGQDHVGVLGVGGDLGDPAIVASQSSP